MLEQQLLNALTLGSVYALFALGFTLVFGVLAVINLSHGAVFMLGSYAALFVVTRFEAPLWLGFVAAALLAGLVGLAVDWLILKPLRARNAPHLIPMIATIGVTIVLTNAAQGFFGVEVQRFPDETLPAGEFVIGEVHVRALERAIVAITFALMAACFIVLRHTQTGRALRAIAESPKAAALGDIRGALIGGLFLGFAEVLGKGYISSQMGDAVAFGLLFPVLLLRPTGLFGRELERKT